jgi:hypothetical protein
MGQCAFVDTNMEQNGTQSAYIGAEGPGGCSLLVPRHATTLLSLAI